MNKRLLTAAVVLGGLTAAGLGAQTPAAIEKLGPQVGQTVPAFTLPDQNGTPTSLKSILGTNGALLVFSRSADW